MAAGLALASCMAVHTATAQVGAGTQRSVQTIVHQGFTRAFPADTGTVVQTDWVNVTGAREVLFYVNTLTVGGGDPSDSALVDSIVDIKIQVSNNNDPRVNTTLSTSALGTIATGGGNKNLTIATVDSTWRIACDHSLYSFTGGINSTFTTAPLVVYAMRRQSEGPTYSGGTAAPRYWEIGTFDRTQWVRIRFRPYGRKAGWVNNASGGTNGFGQARLSLAPIRCITVY